ncbi:MAG: GNAT family N-acetyltransferase [Bacteroidota bacterium]|nr:GNAT family N-acetyltransferase [Bacteroidota bacterium]
MAQFVREFKEEDYQDVLHIWNKTDMGSEHRGDNLDVIEDTINFGGKLFILEDDDHGIIGTSWITNDQRRLYLHHFGILPAFQGKGYSHFLMEKCMEFAMDEGLQIKLEVGKTNHTAKNLYKKYGFKYLGDYDVLIVRNPEDINLNDL